ncbi:MAG: S9 family peptidase, partial [Gemmatimonadaceae bacterium]
MRPHLIESNAARRLLVIGMVAVVQAMPAAAQSPLTVDAAFKLRTIADAAISPDGKWVAYVLERKDLTTNSRSSHIWLVSATGESRRQLTSGDHNDGEPTWAPNSEELAFSSDRDGGSRIWRIRVDGGEARAVTVPRWSATRPRWSPDGSRIAFLSADPLSEAEQLQEKRHQNDQKMVDSIPRPVRLWVVAADGSGDPLRLTSGTRQVNDFVWDPSATTAPRLAAMTSPGSGEFEGMVDTHISVIPADGAAPRDLPIERAWSFASLSWSPDGRYVGYSCSYCALKLGEGRISIIDVSAGTRRTLPTEGDYGLSGYTWAGGNVIVVNTVSGVTGRLLRYDVGANRLTPLSGDGEQLFRSMSSDATGAHLAYIARDAYNPGDVFVTTVASYAPQRLSEANPELAGIRLGKTETVTWKGADGWPMDGVLVRPANYEDGKRYPTIVYIHGGPSGVNTKSFDPFWQLMAARGYAVFAPNPRGGTGHGDKFYAANFKDFGGKDYQDIMLGVDRVIALGVADSARLGVWGWSYGGYMTYWVVTQTNRFKGAV